MKILVGTFTFPPQANGVAEIAKAQACLLAKRGHEVTVVTGVDAERTKEHSFGKLTVREFNIHGDCDPKIGYQGDIKSYQEFLASYGADIMIFNCWQNWTTDLAVPVFSQVRAKKVMVSQGFTAQVWDRHGRFPWGLGQWLRGQPYVWKLPKALRAFDHLIFLSKRQNLGRFFDCWLARRLGMTHYSVIPNGIHLNELAEKRIDFRKLHRIPEDQHLILNVANYCDRKNQLGALRAFLSANRKDAALVFIGNEHNEYTDMMFRILQSHSAAAPRVFILEKVSKELINAVYQTADLFLFSSKDETQPLAVLDAMGAGVPFISTDVGCVDEFPGGIIARSESEMNRALNKVLDDTELSHQLGQEGRVAAQQTYSWESVITKYEQLFQRLTGK